jgi:dynein heavy chain
VDHEVIDWIKEKVESAVKMFDESKHWTKPLEDAVKSLCLAEIMCSKLFVWICEDETKFSTEVPHEIATDTAIIFNFSKDIVTAYDFERKILVRKIEKNHLKSLVGFMNTIFIPAIMNEGTWPDNVKKEFLAQLHKFMTSVTETCFQIEGYTELYIPKEDLSNSDGQDKDLIQRLETTIIQWNRQIKEIVSNPDSHQENENSGPLDEIQYWRNRRENLKHIDEQLENAELKTIVKFLEKMDSNDARGFG